MPKQRRRGRRGARPGDSLLPVHARDMRLLDLLTSVPEAVGSQLRGGSESEARGGYDEAECEICHRTGTCGTKLDDGETR